MKTLQKFGGFAALYEAAAYIVGMIGFLTVVDVTSVVDPVQKVALMADNLAFLYILYLICLCGMGHLHGCPGAGALRAAEGRLTSNNADSDRLRYILGLRDHC